ncbi:AP-2 complex subunit beta-like [Sinocyclocheilus grahami]|uniref:AP-2 complex subunit beta-like n=1 Tax=Sinocyclocheilus grahami TaxID=75366 RepID=UPI0007AD30A6|nr:PREDICTED: AP-2 complex subunit beta-like [Sinocyclocheilus grahami]
MTSEIFELKAELNNEKKEKRKEAVKKVIAAMTVGKDVSSLFPDVVNCMQTDNLELKKLVYLYLMNYAKSQPDMAIMAVNSFVKDCEDPNPLIRALAVRTMGCIRVDKITEYLCEPLRKCLKDEDPYVRKTAAVCVAKLHDINAQMVEDQGFLDSLRDLIADSNPMVVANAVAALSEISESHPNSNLLDLNPQNINKLLTALNECTEWGQIFILDCLSNYNPKDEREIFELKAELNNEKKEKRKEAVKKVIAAMTVGKDVSSLFPDVVNCMQTDNLELKKLVYLYLMNYAKSQPDMAIMAVNSFVKDCEDPNPLIRALAVRTMGCIRVDKITEYLCEPLRKCLKDEDPYVRKTAAVCVAKLHDINAQMVEDQGFLDSLRDLIADSNPMVVANAVAALSEISESHPNSNLLDLNPQNINKLLTALNECTEWGQIFILDCLSNYNPKDEREAQSICERVTPRLSHANSAVVLSAVKVLMKFLELLPKDSDYYNTLLKKLSPPLVTLLSGEPEVQYVALRNINLIVQKRPEILKQEIKVFFVKYNDPIYVKLEKLDIMIRLASHANIAQVLAELKEYATEVDVDFVRKAVRAIGRCAIKVEQSAERCVSTLLDLIQTKVNYVVQEAIVVIRDIFRKYPNKYESIIATLCENLDSLDEPDARAAMIWIVGEYAERIDNADELLESFLEGFHDESTQVQLTLLTAIVKLFLKKPSETQELVQQVLSLATQDSDNPDLRDRGYIYWRLLSTDPVTAKEVVLSEKPLISEETDLIEPTLLDELICHIGSLASVYHKPPNAFVEGSHGIHRKGLS